MEMMGSYMTGEGASKEEMGIKGNLKSTRSELMTSGRCEGTANLLRCNVQRRDMLGIDAEWPKM